MLGIITDRDLRAVFDRIARIEAKLDLVLNKLEKSAMTEQQQLDLLAQIDKTTNAVAANVTTVSQSTTQLSLVAGTIKSEIDALKVSLPAGTPQSVQDAMSALATKSAGLVTAADAATNALVAQIPVLQAIAADGAPTVPPAPGPIAPPPPPPPPPPPAA